MKKVTRVETAKAHKPVRPYYSQAVKVSGGNLLFISGKAPFDIEGNLVGKGDVKAQTKQVIEGLKAVLEEVGATLDDIVKVTVFVKNMKDFEKIAEVRLPYFKKGLCASTLVEVSRLYHPDQLIEIEAIAVVD
jgi:reactive intermediate/imine deaminase